MATVIVDEFRKYFSNLTATNDICSVLGTTFTEGTNLFVGMEPPKKNNCLTIIPFAGSPPSPEGDRHDSIVQLRLKTEHRKKGLETMQSIINTLHNNTTVCSSTNGRIESTTSIPFIAEVHEGGQYVVIVSNFHTKYIKI